MKTSFPETNSLLRKIRADALSGRDGFNNASTRAAVNAVFASELGKLKDDSVHAAVVAQISAMVGQQYFTPLYGPSSFIDLAEQRLGAPLRISGEAVRAAVDDMTSGLSGAGVPRAAEQLGGFRRALIRVEPNERAPLRDQLQLHRRSAGLEAVTDILFPERPREAFSESLSSARLRLRASLSDAQASPTMSTDSWLELISLFQGMHTLEQAAELERLLPWLAEDKSGFHFEDLVVFNALARYGFPSATVGELRERLSRGDGANEQTVRWADAVVSTQATFQEFSRSDLNQPVVSAYRDETHRTLTTLFSLLSPKTAASQLAQLMRVYVDFPPENTEELGRQLTACVETLLGYDFHQQEMLLAHGDALYAQVDALLRYPLAPELRVQLTRMKERFEA